MKSLILCFCLCTFSFLSFGQDTIRKHDGTVLVGTVKEIDDVTLTYVRIDQPDGPLRKIPLHEVSEIRYKDGTLEIFHVSPPPTRPAGTANEPEYWEPGTINNTGRVVIIKRHGPDIRVYPGQRFPGSRDASEPAMHGYLEGMTGFARSSWSVYEFDYNTYTYQTKYKERDGAQLAIRFGSLVYFGTGRKHRFGLNLAWVQLHGLFSSDVDPDVIVAPVNPGFASSFKVGEFARIEANTSMGLVFSSLFMDVFGFRYGAEVKFRYKMLGIGLDFSRAQSQFDTPREFVNSVSLVMGVRFGR